MRNWGNRFVAGGADADADDADGAADVAATDVVATGSAGTVDSAVEAT